MQLAIQLSSFSSERQRHGCVIVKNGRVLAVGANRFRNDPNNLSKEHANGNCSVHAEIDALRRLRSAKGCRVFVVRVNATGRLLLSRPCSRCYTALDEAGVKEVVYS